MGGDTCSRCGGLILVMGVSYGYSGQVCSCVVPDRRSLVEMNQSSVISTALELRVEALEQSAQANEAALGELDGAIRTLSGELDGIRAIILWLAKQPWEVDQATTWDDLVAKASAGPKKESKFRAEVVL